jgi:alpha-glucosidase
VQAQTGVAGSTLELYRGALRLRHELSALRVGSMRWLDSPSGSLVFAREVEDGAVVCAVNLSTRAIQLPVYGEALIASAEHSDPATLPAESARWCRLG